VEWRSETNGSGQREGRKEREWLCIGQKIAGGTTVLNVLRMEAENRAVNLVRGAEEADGERGKADESVSHKIKYCAKVEGSTEAASKEESKR